MRTIDVDFDVFKALTARRANEQISENDVLRSLLGLSSKRSPTAQIAADTADDWIVKGVRFPSGTEFRASYKGQTWLGRADHGALVVNGQRFDTPSAGAVYITKTPTNGWTFWESRIPGQSSWQIIKALRRKN